MHAIPADVRAAVVARDGGACVLCAAPYDHVHHLRTRNAGGGHTPDNLCCLCATHHSAVHDVSGMRARLLDVLRKRGINVQAKGA